MSSISNLSSSLQSVMQAAQQASQAKAQSTGSAKSNFTAAVKEASGNDPLSSVTMSSLANGATGANTSAQITSAATSNLLNIMV